MAPPVDGLSIRCPRCRFEKTWSPRELEAAGEKAAEKVTDAEMAAKARAAVLMVLRDFTLEGSARNVAVARMKVRLESDAVAAEYGAAIFAHVMVPGTVV